MYTMRAINEGMLGMSFTNTSPFLSPTRSKEVESSIGKMVDCYTNKNDFFCFVLGSSWDESIIFRSSRKKPRQFRIGYGDHCCRSWKGQLKLQSDPERNCLNSN